ncbi:carbon-nitrogen hydrolase family protein [Shivajiella indica]|uniref:Carbon-nitrogen hydrolase family protein n=1 Tax=Shivajiella indica TaxID=872115 RepID=A0ABW5BBB9_9BACT
MKIVLSLILLVITAWIIWANTGFNSKLPDITSEISLIEDILPFHPDSTRGNIVGIQPYMLESDYLNKDQFSSKLETYFQAAKESGFFRENTLVILPEYLGTWLVIANEKKSVGTSNSLTLAMVQLVLSHPLQFFDHYLMSKQEKDRIAAALFRMKAESMASIYQDSFSYLAKKYKVYIIGGSINLPGPQIIKGEIQVDKEEPIFNTSFVFGSDGHVLQQHIRKAYPIESEKPFIENSPTNKIPQFQLAEFKIGVLVCADSWYPESYEAIQGVDLVLVPSYCATDGAMEIPWAGYNGAPAPRDVDIHDIGNISEREAWEKYALPGRIAQSGASSGVNVFLRGRLWDLGTDGQPFFIRNGELLKINAAQKGGIWNMDF